MIRKIFYATVFFTTLNSFADTRAMFAKDGSKATVLMMAFTTNPDAIAFNEAMAVEAADEQGKAVKKIDFTDKNGDKPFVAFCVFSKLAPDTGTCTLTFKPAEGVDYSASSGTIHYEVSGDDAVKLAALFKKTETTGEFFRSSDNHLVGRVDVESGRWSLTYE